MYETTDVLQREKWVACSFRDVDDSVFSPFYKRKIRTINVALFDWDETQMQVESRMLFWHIKESRYLKYYAVPDGVLTIHTLLDFRWGGGDYPFFGVFYYCMDGPMRHGYVLPGLRVGGDISEAEGLACYCCVRDNFYVLNCGEGMIVKNDFGNKRKSVVITMEDVLNNPEYNTPVPRHVIEEKLKIMSIDCKRD